MKRWILALAAATAAACAATALTVWTTAARPRAVQEQTLSAEVLAKKSGCFECHAVDKKVVGPAYKDVAARYKDDPKARAALIEIVKKGGKDHWSDITNGIPMPPHGGRLSGSEIARLVDWVLSLKDGDDK